MQRLVTGNFECDLDTINAEGSLLIHRHRPCAGHLGPTHGRSHGLLPTRRGGAEHVAVLGGVAFRRPIEPSAVKLDFVSGWVSILCGNSRWALNHLDGDSLRGQAYMPLGRISLPLGTLRCSRHLRDL